MRYIPATVSSIWTIYDGKLINIVSKLKDPLPCQSWNISWEIVIFVHNFFLTSIFIVCIQRKTKLKFCTPTEIIKYIVWYEENFLARIIKEKIDLSEYIMLVSLCITIYMLNWIAYVTVLISIYPLFWLQWSHGKIPVFEKHMFEIVWFSIYNLKGSEGWDLRIPTGCSQCDMEIGNINNPVLLCILWYWVQVTSTNLDAKKVKSAVFTRDSKYRWE